MSKLFFRKSLYAACLLISGVVFFSSCVTTKSSTYFYNISDTSFSRAVEAVEPTIQKNDILSITISSLNAEASAVFNTTNDKVVSATTATGTNAQSGGYLVNSDGDVQLPILGNIKAAGLTNKQLKEHITKLLVDKKLLLDPIVNVRHLNFEVTVIGEVGHPTVITVPNEKISLLKALGLAGDITIYGKKDNVLLVREVDGKKMVRRINLNSEDFMTSPYYYLQPNDVIYVEPTKDKVASVSHSQQLLPAILTGLSVVVIIVDRLTRN